VWVRDRCLFFTIIVQRLVIEKTAVLDRIDACADGALGGFGTVGVAAVFLRRAWASSTMASSSACVNCGVSTSSVGESTAA